MSLCICFINNFRKKVFGNGVQVCFLDERSPVTEGEGGKHYLERESNVRKERMN